MGEESRTGRRSRQRTGISAAPRFRFCAARRHGSMARSPRLPSGFQAGARASEEVWEGAPVHSAAQPHGGGSGAAALGARARGSACMVNVETAPVLGLPALPAVTACASATSWLLLGEQQLRCWLHGCMAAWLHGGSMKSATGALLSRGLACRCGGAAETVCIHAGACGHVEGGREQRV